MSTPFSSLPRLPSFKFDLSLSPSLRWSKIINTYGRILPILINEMWENFEDLNDDENEDDNDEEDEKQHKGSNKQNKQQTKKPNKQQLKSFLNISSSHRNFAESLTSKILSGLHSAQMSDYVEELLSIAAVAEICIVDLILLNLSYEQYSGCTTVIGIKEDG